jgi:hypothetical protein
MLTAVIMPRTSNLPHSTITTDPSNSSPTHKKKDIHHNTYKNKTEKIKIKK